MRGILTFRLPQEMEEFDDARNGSLWHVVCQEIDNHLRDITKYANQPEARAMADEIRAELLGMIESRNLALWD